MKGNGAMVEEVGHRNSHSFDERQQRKSLPTKVVISRLYPVRVICLTGPFSCCTQVDHITALLQNISMVDHAQYRLSVAIVCLCKCLDVLDGIRH
ncbi:hypothetical protein EVAR_102398_1 [Eumeta japonica]|uniref:Uncharacterized protein n=1 Tax=Eumeta variegata TaxID=151549 RepID=A0A4C1YMZ7_EUMVA|nr:hypothetical protein EVAR_102398_1 [Eumeta japonica]